MKRFFNLLLCLISMAGIVYALVLLYEGSRPCGSDGCLIRLLIPIAIVIFLITAPVFYFAVKRQKRYFREKRHLKQTDILKNNSYMPFRLNNKVWTLTGLILITAALITWRIVVNNKNQKNIQLVSQPQAGDIYEMATENQQYTLLKVARVQGDSVYVRINSYETDKQSGLSQLKDQPFAEEEIGFSKQNLRLMLKEGKILDVER